MDASLKEIKECCDSYSENLVKYILYSTLKGIAFLHNENIIHRDIRSENILVDTQG